MGLVAHMDPPGLEVTGRGEARLLGGIAPGYLRRGVRLRFYSEGEPIPAPLRTFAPKGGGIPVEARGGGKDRRLNLKALLTRAEELGFVGTLAAAEAGVIPRNAVVVSVEASRAIPGVEVGGGPVIRVGGRARPFEAGAGDPPIA